MLTGKRVILDNTEPEDLAIFKNLKNNAKQFSINIDNEIQYNTKVFKHIINNLIINSKLNENIIVCI